MIKGSVEQGGVVILNYNSKLIKDNMVFENIDWIQREIEKLKIEK